MIDRAHSRVSVHRQCVLLGVPRSTVYYRAHPRPVDDRLLRAIDRIYTAFPFMGRRQIHRMLKAEGTVVNLKTVHRAMRILGMVAVAPGPHTSKPHPQHPKYPYLLRNVAIDRPNQVWSADAASPDGAFVPVLIAALPLGTLATTAELLTYSLATLVLILLLVWLATWLGLRWRWAWLDRNGERLNPLILMILGLALVVGL